MKIRLHLVVLLVFLLAFGQGCAEYELPVDKDGAPSLWQEVGLSEGGLDFKLGETDDGFALEELEGELLAFLPLQSDHSFVVVTRGTGHVSFALLDLQLEQAEALGTVVFSGSAPSLEAVAWPQALLGATDPEGNHGWLLLDFSGSKAEITWQHSARIPPGLVGKQVWRGEEHWYLGPVAGPYCTDIFSGEIIDLPGALNPVDSPWPAWTGGAEGSNWFLLPVEAGACLQNLATGAKVSLADNRDLALNRDGSLLAWQREDSLGLVDAAGQQCVLAEEGTMPEAPLWSEDGDKMYFLKGNWDCFGPRCRELWSWTEQGGPVELFTLPGSWSRWRLLAAADDAVLAGSGAENELLIYFDVVGNQTHELEPGAYGWWRGRLAVLEAGRLTLYSPACHPKVIYREVPDLKVEGLFEQYLLYSLEETVYIKPLP